VAKYKIKTHSGAKRRFYVTGRGKLMQRKSHVNHLRRKKRPGTLRMLGDKFPASPANVKRLRRLLPYA
jgi:large subunit ribosomal protein L35